MSAFQWDDSAVDDAAIACVREVVDNRPESDIFWQLAHLYAQNRELQRQITDAKADAEASKADAEMSRLQLREFTRKKLSKPPLGRLTIEGRRAVIEVLGYGEGALWPNGFSTGDLVRIKRS